MKPILLVFALVMLGSGCGDGCITESKRYRPRECAIKVASSYVNGRFFTISGTNVINGSQNRFSDIGNWYPLFEDHVAIGDTVVKRKGELVFYIHKKDTVLAFPFTCQGDVYE